MAQQGMQAAAVAEATSGQQVTGSTGNAGRPSAASTEAPSPASERPAGGVHRIVGEQWLELMEVVSYHAKLLVRCSGGLSMVLALVALLAFWVAPLDCSGSRVGLKAWYVGLLALEGITTILWLAMMKSVFHAWRGKTAPAHRSGQPPASPTGGDVEPVAGVQADDDTDVADTEASAEARERCSAMVLTVVFLVELILLVLWSSVGALSATSSATCGSAYAYFWSIYIRLWLYICCVTGEQAAEAYCQMRPKQPDRAHRQEIAV